MKILITGKGGHSGSWKVRGEQLGAAIGADVVPMCTDFRGYDLIIVVKRPPPAVVNALVISGKPWVWDIVDAWPQGSIIGMGKTEAVRWLQAQIAQWQPTGIVFGTEQMKTDAGTLKPSLILPHHSWGKYLDRVPIVRGQVSIVGYEGGEQYLGRWRSILRNACNARGWFFQINGDMGNADIGISLRDSGGYPAKHWKPGTKLSNLHALGIPALCSPEDGSKSVACGSEFWIQSEADVWKAFEVLSSYRIRQEIGAKMRASAIPVSRVAETYIQWLATL